jgi:Response regulator containing a CheY-like receiver domain and an HTH DNA-binding domain
MSRLVVANRPESIRDAVSLPVEPAENATPKITTRILIAEDRESMRDALKHLLGLHENWEVCGEAQDTKEAVSKAEQLHPDLIVMDYKMQDGDGLQAAAKIFRVLPDVPIVLFTLYKTAELERAANAIGIRCVVGKEEGAHTLLQGIESQLPKPAN